MSKILDLELGGADDFISTKTEPRKREPLVFRILSSARYVIFLKIAQYLSCVCLALTLFVHEFFQSGAFLAEQIIYYVSVAAPTVFLHIPLYVGFITSLPSPVRKIVWSRFKKQLLLEGILLALLVTLIPIAIYYTIRYQKEKVLDSVVSIPGSTLSVIYYFFSFTSFRHYKNEILSDKNEVGNEGTRDKDCQWAHLRTRF